MICLMLVIQCLPLTFCWYFLVTQDALLLHVVPIYDGKDWVSIAKHMGGDVTNEQCRNRCNKSLHLYMSRIDR